MSASFIIRYAGQGVQIVQGQPVLVDDYSEATPFVSEQDAWYAAFKADFNPDKVKVINLYAENLKPIQP